MNQPTLFVPVVLTEDEAKAVAAWLSTRALAIDDALRKARGEACGNCTDQPPWPPWASDPNTGRLT